MSFLKVEGLSLHAGSKTLVETLSFYISQGEILAIVGESGSGKTLSALSILNLLPLGVRRSAGHIMLDGVDVTSAAPAVLQKLRGGIAGMIFQEPMSSLNPLSRVGKQIAEALMLHGNCSNPARRRLVLEMLASVGISDAERIVDSYPHLLSGGQRQRIMIAMALANNPRLLIADEPTSALDVTMERQILDLIVAEQKSRGLGVLLITHDLGLVRRYADRVLVMDNGRAVETAITADIFVSPQHEKTRRLLAAGFFPLPTPASSEAREILNVQYLTVKFRVFRGMLRQKVGEVLAVDNVSFNLREGETLGIIGESGSGKSTIALALLRLIKFQGKVLFEGKDLGMLRPAELRAMRAKLQIVFQDPYGSLAPRMTVGDIVAEGLTIHARHLSKAERAAKAAAVLREVGLPEDAALRYPHEFSGGQRQRIAIARAMILQPKLLVLDEPTSALDVTVQAEILRLLQTLQREHGTAYIFISHNIQLVRALAHKILVLQSGRVVEYGDARDMLETPQAEYTKLLSEAAVRL
ncbi:MAG TPA: dipeptide ABC transporter ATP-binding protein [Acidocella sp.]|nr:dipeptide ABC transporter ATP-binding protein [Acidocella sp.]